MRDASWLHREKARRAQRSAQRLCRCGGHRDLLQLGEGGGKKHKDRHFRHAGRGDCRGTVHPRQLDVEHHAHLPAGGVFHRGAPRGQLSAAHTGNKEHAPARRRHGSVHLDKVPHGLGQAAAARPLQPVWRGVHRGRNREDGARDALPRQLPDHLRRAVRLPRAVAVHDQLLLQAAALREVSVQSERAATVDAAPPTVFDRGGGNTCRTHALSEQRAATVAANALPRNGVPTNSVCRGGIVRFRETESEPLFARREVSLSRRAASRENASTDERRLGESRAVASLIGHQTASAVTFSRQHHK